MMMSTNQGDLYNCLPDAIQEIIQEEGYCAEEVCRGAESYIDDLTIQNDRMMGVLSNFHKMVAAYANADDDLEFKGDQGSERREFEKGTYCGRTCLANKLMAVLMEQAEEPSSPPAMVEDEDDEVYRERLEEIICNGIHSEKPVFDYCGGWFQVRTEIWCPDVYNISNIEEAGLTYHGQNGDSFVFRRKV